MVSTRSEPLLFLALLGGVYSYGLLNPPRPLTAQFEWVQTLLPLWVWAILWGVAAALCLVFAFWPRRDMIGFHAAMAMLVGWGLLNLLGWIFREIDRGYISAVIFLGFAYFVVYRMARGVPPPYRPGQE